MKDTTIHFIASVEDDHLDKLKAVAKRLKSMGCSIDTILTVSGIITGSAPADTNLDDLKVEGIKHIEIDRQVKAISKS